MSGGYHWQPPGAPRAARVLRDPARIASPHRGLGGPRGLTRAAVAFIVERVLALELAPSARVRHDQWAGGKRSAAATSTSGKAIMRTRPPRATGDTSA